MEHNTNLLNDVPHVRQISLHADAIKELICQRLSWTTDKYAEFVYDAAISFLSIVAEPLKGKDSKDMAMLNRSPLFWGWWRNEWYTRDCSIYKWRSLSELDYEFLHTNDVATCADTVGRFWNTAADMIKSGEKALKQQVNA